MRLDSTDKKLLNLIQADFPLTGKPYARLGQQLSIDEDEVIRRITVFKTDGIIRQISPVIDARSLGYRTTLVAMRVSRSELDKAEGIIAGHPGVSHGYERDHHYNVWFTLAVPPEADTDTELEKLTSQINAEVAFALPAVKVFKIGVYFDMEGNGESSFQASSGITKAGELSPADKQVINRIQQDLPLASAPFNDMAAEAGMELNDFLTQCRSLLERGVIRRYGASLNHRRAGFTANAMTCWIAPADKVDSAGRKLAALAEVSHCYERETNRHWQQNLFAMIHGQSPEDCRQIADRISQEADIGDCMLLFSTREFKKVRNSYPV